MRNEWQEKELEDYVASSPPELTSLLLGYTMGGKLRILGRQVRCHTGIIDLLIGFKMFLYVVEIKATRANEGTVGQVIRYVESLKIATEKAFWLYVPSPEDNAHLVDKFYPPIPVIIAPSFTQAAVNAIVYTGFAIEAKREGGRFALSPASHHYRYDQTCESALLPLLKEYTQSSAIAAARWEKGIET